MLRVQDIWSVLSSPYEYLFTRLHAPPPPHVLFLEVATPLIALRSLAVLLRSLLAASLVPGLVLGSGSFVLQAGTWLGVALVLPAITHQFGLDLNERRAFVLTTYASIPLWLAGVLYLVPEDVWSLFLWSRALVVLASAYGLLVLFRGIEALVTDRATRIIFVLAFAGAYLLIYFFLSVLLGFGSHFVLFVLQSFL